MFSWMRHYVADVCALPSALLVKVCFDSAGVRFERLTSQTQSGHSNHYLTESRKVISIV